MTKKHTPGPWSLDDSECGDLRIVDAENRRFALVLGAFPEYRDDDDAEAVANARLIAAAPDLLAALQEARDALFAGAPVTVGLECQINAAIAKAEGRDA